MKNYCTRLLTILLTLSLFAACKKEDKKPLILGQWQGSYWLVNGKDAGYDVSSVSFEFRQDDTYTAKFSQQTEDGRFRLSGDKLYTTGENKIEKMVKLMTFTADSLVMDMNRVGNSEQLTLVRPAR